MLPVIPALNERPLFDIVKNLMSRDRTLSYHILIIHEHKVYVSFANICSMCYYTCSDIY